MNPAQIRNFSIIAHIDHGKSTLADRMLELTGTIEKRKMQAQVLDSMELERERGITIKLQPVRMKWSLKETIAGAPAGEYVLNLIDTPGHIDFSYEVSRSLKAVEGSILLVDATQGVQAQTLTTLNMAREAGLVIIPVVSKIDSPLAQIEETVKEISQLLGCHESEVIKVSGKTGEGVEHLLDKIISKIPPPSCASPARNKGSFASSATLPRSNPSLRFPDGKGVHVREPLPAAETPTVASGIRGARETSFVSGGATESFSAAESFKEPFRSLVFDFQYSNHTGMIVYVRVFDGQVRKHDKLQFKIAGKTFEAIEAGIFAPQETPVEYIGAGEIGYIVTGIKEPGIASVGDTVASIRDNQPPLSGYQSPKPVVWASIYPESQDNLPLLRQALARLRLSDAAFTYEEEASGTLGKGYRSGFLGMLHLEIVTERLRREYNLELVVTMPTIIYSVRLKNDKETKIYSPALFPDDHDIMSVSEPVVTMKIITPPPYIGGLMKSIYDHEGEIVSTDNFGDSRTILALNMPLRELMRNFFDEVKSVSSGYASISYDITGARQADVTRLDILVADEPVPAFARVVSRRRVQEEAESAVERLHKLLPRELFTFKIQAKAHGRILASRTLSGMKKDAAGTLSGGDITRKMKLREKQKEGRKRLKARGKVAIAQDVFVKMMRAD
ncbi:GTP-binding protein [Patescibacteria group bacterium]|nr:GTP-binding protein [Patescibacteria group bacterium]MDE1946723.1 GTP-binding protein [Patescibacteria group bacterium]MDE2010974.1 GTP-binding protein [Patescibacteria group bacterium]MDE2232817.1 GTP-binding protein [Patescibacteria group bacterium]